MVVGGWTIFAHPLLLKQLERATAAVEKAKATDPEGFQATAQAKLLAMMVKLIFDTVPADPTRPDYRQGGALGNDRKHWFRVKFGNCRFRLFFRYDSRPKVIIFACANDANTLRTYGSRTDAYRVFKTLLDKGDPPDDRPALLAAASAKAVVGRLERVKPDKRSSSEAD